MVKKNRKRQRNRGRKESHGNQNAPIKNRDYKWVVAITFGMAAIGGYIGQTVDAKTAVTLGILGFVMGAIGGAAILIADELPDRKGTEMNRHNHIGGNDMPDIDEILDEAYKKQ